MATAKSELEELRRIRQAEREAAEALKREEEEKARERDRRNEFKSRMAQFSSPKKAPTAEEIKADISKAAEKRKFNKALGKALQSASTSGVNPFAVELALRNKLENEEENHEFSGTERKLKDSCWEEVDQGRDLPPYYWNRLTGEVSYEPPNTDEHGNDERKAVLKMLDSTTETLQFSDIKSASTSPQISPPIAPPRPPPPPPPRPSSTSFPSSSSDTQITNLHYKWQKVPGENGGMDYFWNPETGEVQWDAPDDFVILSSPDSLAIPCEDPADYTPPITNPTSVLWAEVIDECTGEVVYQNLASPEITRSERPTGQVLIVSEEEGIEIHYREESEGDNLWYIKLTTGERFDVRPMGTTVIAESEM